MNFLSNLWSGIKNTASKLVANASTVGGKNAASAGMAFPLMPGTTLSGRNQTPIPNQTVIPTATDRGGVGTGGVSVNNIAFKATQNQAAITASTMRPSTYTEPGGMTPMPAGGPKWTPPVDEYGRVSSKQSGVPYFDAKGNYVVPQTGHSGVSGGGASLMSVAPTGAQGAGGADAAGGFRSAGQGTTAASYNQPTSDEEKRKREEGSTIIANPTQQAMNALAAQGQQAPIETPSVPDVVDAGWLSRVQETISSTKGSAIPEQDKQAVYAQLQSNLMGAKAKLDLQMQLPPNPVEDTPAQIEWLNQQADPTGAKLAMDQWTAENTNLNQLLTDRNEVRKTIRGIEEAYKPIMNEIKSNPNMPKALARRKIEALAFTSKEALSGLLASEANLNDAIGLQQEKVNYAFKIKEDREEAMEKQLANSRNAFNLYVNNPLLLAGLSDYEIKTLAQAAGYSPSSLTKLREEALKPKVDIVTNEDANGNWVAVDKNTGKTIWKAPGFAKASGTGGGGETFKSGGATIPGTAIAEGEQRLLASRGQDGYVDPTVYLNMYNTWVSKGGLVKDFVATYKPEDYVNPANTWLPKEIMPKEKVSNPFR